MWIKKLQIAIIEKDADTISILIETTPKFESVKEIESAIYLLKEANEVMHTLKNETALTMKQLKKNIDFLESTQPQIRSKLDLRF
ncbi:hypothetical protein Suden_0204 [Sulfurimonas denitrificans DSM 1251]|uniref:Uncharacterized protein n=1 Tax=Sulfurimonas denitrificans (strain ATCC 33889 / DSM 1251) TaxID=326298 RepID=Q30U46_SULDN|nr:hypothetical protein [Sulfurimonas denitrificans]ABB43485.1 hypothetical protein Suden_0204 [Sulfurimonas denitrificans DSM 1251]